MVCMFIFFFSSRRRHTRLQGDWSSDVCSSDLCPQLQIRLAFDAVDIREEAGHQSGSDQQGQRYKTLMHQENIRFSARTAHGIVQVTKAEESLVLCSVPATLPPARRTIMRRRRKVAPVH